MVLWALILKEHTYLHKDQIYKNFTMELLTFKIPKIMLCSLKLIDHPSYQTNKVENNLKKLKRRSCQSLSCFITKQKNNLLQSHGLIGTRYKNGMDTTMISEENFDENFNSLLLNNNADGVGGSVEDAKGIGLRTSKDGLTQAIQD